MKIILYNSLHTHHKNLKAIYDMCASCNVELEASSDFNRICQPDYDILMSFKYYLDPASIPQKIKIVYGPQFFVFPQGELVGPLDESLAKRCVYNALSPWNTEVYKETCPHMRIPLKTFPFAVDLNAFRPSTEEKTIDCLVYVKRRSQHIINATLSLLQAKGLKYHVLQYGSYAEEDYKSLLHKSKFMITLDAHESQGFALEEAMACNVPLLVLDATSMYDETSDGHNSSYEYMKPLQLKSTSVPYWSDICGIKITDINDLPNTLNVMLDNWSTFTPRKYIEETLSPKVCMERILEWAKL
jgi:glycosyltransferase involved in cell wall biosynthesis